MHKWKSLTFYDRTYLETRTRYELYFFASYFVICAIIILYRSCYFKRILWIAFILEASVSLCPPHLNTFCSHTSCVSQTTANQWLISILTENENSFVKTSSFIFVIQTSIVAVVCVYLNSKLCHSLVYWSGKYNSRSVSPWLFAWNTSFVTKKTLY